MSMQIGKILAAAGFAAVVALGFTGNAAEAMAVTGVSQDMTVADKTVMAADLEGEKVRFQADGRVLRFMNGDGTQEYLAFNSFDGIYTNTEFKIRAIETEDPAMRLFEILATRGTKNCGYWLVGKSNGVWVTYASWNSLANLGFRVDRWHTLKSEIVNQQLVVTSRNARGRADFRAKIFWNAQDKWFGVERIWLPKKS